MITPKDIHASISQLWHEIESGKAKSETQEYRIYRRLDLNKENGIRVSCFHPNKTLELLVEVGGFGEVVSFDFPTWTGMGFEIVLLDVPKKATQHIRLYLENEHFRDIFTTVCADLIEGLDECFANQERRDELSRFLDRWSRFFEHHGNEGLSAERQRGLFGELWWIRRMVNKGVAQSTAIKAWKGCERGYHDFDLMGHVVEVKTTMTKEPRKVQISNERQLDETGLKNLHLYVLTLIKNDFTGETLPELVTFLKTILSGLSAIKFEHSLREAGYLNFHEELYTSSYTVQREELFHVTDGFPRIVTIPQGTGDLGYSVLLAACTAFITDIDKYAMSLTGSRQK